MLDNLTQKQKNIFFIILIVVAIGFIYFIYNKNSNSNNIDLNEDILVSNTTNTNENNESNENILIVHITGSVKNPGIVKLPDGSRIEDAINAAGGLTENADISNVNLAYFLDDGVKIQIPSISDEGLDVEDIINKNIGSNIILEDNKSSKNTKSTVNINKATAGELETLPGIRPYFG